MDSAPSTVTSIQSASNNLVKTKITFRLKKMVVRQSKTIWSMWLIKNSDHDKEDLDVPCDEPLKPSIARSPVRLPPEWPPVEDTPP
jgi:hypothetical protein